MARNRGAGARRRRERRRQARLANSFNCPSCNHADSVEVSMNYKRKTGVAKCRVCGDEFGMAINWFSAVSDVHAAWVDMCRRVDNREAGASGSTSASARN